jgi:hypothetical protein
MTQDEGTGVGRPARPRPTRVSKRKLRVAAALAGLGAFVLPWGVLAAVPKPPVAQAAQVIALPGGGRVVIPQGPVGPSGIRYVYVKGHAGSAPTAPATATTRASAVPKP